MTKDPDLALAEISCQSCRRIAPVSSVGLHVVYLDAPLRSFFTPFADTPLHLWNMTVGKCFQGLEQNRLLFKTTARRHKPIILTLAAHRSTAGTPPQPSSLTHKTVSYRSQWPLHALAPAKTSRGKCL